MVIRQAGCIISFISSYWQRVMGVEARFMHRSSLKSEIAEEKKKFAHTLSLQEKKKIAHTLSLPKSKSPSRPPQQHTSGILFLC